MRVRNAMLAIAAVAGAAAAAYVTTVAMTGLGIPAPAPGRARPTRDPADARELFARVRARDGANIDPRCHSRLYTPADGVAPKASIVLFHGFTNCPAQFEPVAKVLAEWGYAVYVPRAPFHGTTDGLDLELVDVTAEDIVAYVNSAVDVAAGLGGPVWVAGLSTGGTLAAWAGATRHEVERVVSIAPIIAPFGSPMPVARLMAFLEPIVPSGFYNWWDWSKKDALKVAPYASPGFPARSILPFVRMGQALVDRRLVPNHQLQRATLILNPDDVAIDAGCARLMMSRTFSGFADSLVEMDLTGGKGWPHDFVDQRGGSHASPEQVAGFIAKGLGVTSPQTQADAELSTETPLALDGARKVAVPTTAPAFGRTLHRAG
jgi:carboxylesterase